jgi:hypothetical protein
MSLGLFIAFILVIAFCWRRIVPGTIERSLATSSAPRLARRADKIGEASIESFPCGGPPARTLGVEAVDALPVSSPQCDAHKGS